MAGCGSIKRAADMQAGPIQDVRVKHGRGDILVPEELLHCSNVISVFKQMGREAVSESWQLAAFFITEARIASLTAFCKFFSET